jgi:hypothetical protein
MKRKCLFLLKICITIIAFASCHQGDTDSISYGEKQCNSVDDENSYIKDFEHINSYVYGIDMKAKRNLVLSNAAMHFIKEASCPVDSTLPVVHVQYMKDYKGYELYRIGDAVSSIFDELSKVTEIDYIGPYVIEYDIKGDESLSNETILLKGFNDKVYMLNVNEISWFVLMDPNSTRHIVVKNAWTEQDCYKQFDNFLKSEYNIKMEEVVEPIASDIHNTP